MNSIMILQYTYNTFCNPILKIICESINTHVYDSLVITIASYNYELFTGGMSYLVKGINKYRYSQQVFVTQDIRECNIISTSLLNFLIRLCNSAR